VGNRIILISVAWVIDDVGVVVVVGKVCGRGDGVVAMWASARESPAVARPQPSLKVPAEPGSGTAPCRSVAVA